jgi:hypothetical protein
MAPERVLFIRGILPEPEDVLDGDVGMHSVERSTTGSLLPCSQRVHYRSLISPVSRSTSASRPG